jgi:hypothetical protein
LDVGGLDVVIEVRTRLSAHRMQDKQRRVDLIRDRVSGLPLGQAGVWLILCEGAWSQS